MKIKTITIEVGRTKKLREYENARVSITNTADLDEPVEHDSKAYRRAHRDLGEQLVKAVNKILDQFEVDEE